MRILLVDNYDSYTYNLFHLLAVAAGSEPVVLANDDPRLTAVEQLDVGCVVISPGPGRPQQLTDLGWGWELLDRHPGLPVLGVCLGHQAIALHAGAQVREQLPRHGHLDEVRHDGDALFAGMPQRFTAVRYHSLQVVEPLPAELAATAWAADGTVMAVRHRRLPRWGVQFHPESIGTEHGLALARNFLALAADSGPVGGRRPPVATPAPAPAGPSESAPAPGPPSVPSVGGWHRDVAVIESEIDTEAAFLQLYAGSPYSFWLDGSDTADGRSRFSFLGDAAGPHAEVLRYQVGSGRVEVARPDGSTGFEPGTIFDVLDRRLADRRLAADDLPFDLGGGYVGYFGYETKADCAATTARLADTPDAVWMFADRLIVVDHQRRRTYLVALSAAAAPAAEVPAADTGRAASRAWLTATATTLRHLAATRPEPLPEPLAPTADAQLGRWAVPARDRPRYLADIDAALRQLRRGESYEICLTNQLRLPAIEDPLAYFRVLRRINPAPYAAYLRLADVAVASSSPERFLRIRRDGTVSSTPIKGTAARGADPRHDDELRRGLTDAPKTRAENLMIVDLVRNDLGRVCEIGSVEVPRFMATETYPTVHQLVSTVQGRLRPATSPVDCVRACFPGGSMTGAPKLRTMEIIDRLEGEARGIYSGALGYFGLTGGADLSIVIRTAVATGDGVTVGVGGAIVLDSDPADEYAETMLKARALLTAYQLATRSVR
ncbi:aminodeoxychorismate synthase component I [Micromonospora sp. NBC_01813]|uniref:aminodeoxychorismate synthase component I n=1 Tax=Micromonospora sp. NBC_01813 TaxID=2975988 RepID=UPI002DD97DC9|nr:aminodeoxychorismate synthase component I [Micromonospora sp. NBC_01813]WSA10036.1 aminodeoxychorismate synthase component I [Micromonospora sp. NBC_01813]